ncbi:MAG: MG2 domain-containing protein, partial [Maribacter sp.]
MKYFALIFTVILFSNMAQSQQKGDTYEVLWKKVQKLENEALTKSALDVVNHIAEKAKKENNSPQIVKALLYASKYALTLEEDAQLKIINDFKSGIEKAGFPTKNVLESYLAILYWQYFQQNRYQFYNRTNTESKIDSTDFRTWDLTTLFEEISVHFDNSLKNEEALQKVAIDDLQEVLQDQKGSEIYRPTLFDLLAHTALDFYKTSENNITRPADKFEIDNPDLLCEVKEFYKQNIETKDKTSLQSKALQIYQQLVGFHTSNNNLDALVEVDIERLNFVHQNATFTKKDEQFLEVLKNSAEGLKQREVSALYNYEIAALYNQLGNSYHPKTNTEQQWKQKEAIELCESVILEFPKSRGADKCKSLKSNILSKTLQLTTEQHIPINKPSRLLVNYKNHDGLMLYAYEATTNDFKKLEELYPEPKKLAFIRQLKIAKEWDAKLKNEGDYQRHSTEILLPELDNGQYIILATPKEKSTSFVYSNLQVTNLALVESHSNTHHIFQVIDRNNGQPKNDAKLKLSYQENYDRKFLSKTYTTDNLGMVNIPLPDKRWTSISTTVVAGDDIAHFGDYYINQKSNSSRLHNINYTAFLFTDRSIYRPGQPLYFKGIAIKRENETSSIPPNILLNVSLRDANNQEVAKQDFTTNEYGSFTGEFILPNNGLTGNFSLEVSSKAININGNADFSVEEYKRPKFETFFEPITETYKVNDSISVTGKATAYAGSNITDAKVVYRVKRVVNFPSWYYWSRPYFDSSPQEISHGETLTDASGKYEICFKAIPDNTANKKDLPVFNYEVTADVTDINGETHSTTTTVRVGYHALIANIVVDSEIDKDKKDNSLTINTQNLNGEFVPAKGSITFYKLKSPANVLRKRPWENPDYDGFSKSEFEKLYPHDAFKEEHDPSKWEKGEIVLRTDFNSDKSKVIQLGNTKKWASGNYRIELESKDKFGQQVIDFALLVMSSEKDKKLADNNQLFLIKSDKDSYSTGDEVNLTLFSNAENLNVTVNIEKDRKIIKTQLIYLNNDSKSITIPVNKEDLGGFAVNYNFSAFNSFQSSSVTIAVPYPKTDLQIETVTFRDKLRPGTDETLIFKIKGPKGEKVSAELLASMYDASLDTFRDHYWSFNPLYKPTYYSSYYNNARQSYGISSFREHNADMIGYSYKPQYYDTFDWFGLHFGYGYGLYRERRMMKTVAPMAIMEIMEDGAVLDEVVVVENDLAGNVAGV